MDNWQITTKPDSNVTIGVQTNGVDLSRVNNTNNAISFNQAIDLKVEVRPCILGEITVGYACERCEENYYSLDPTQVK